jgi:uncharacterized membrane protein
MRKRYFLICGIIILATLVAGMALYDRLPERVPSHWDIHGNINGHATRTRVIFLFPAIMTGMMLLFAVLPVISPRRFEVDRFRSTYLYIMVLMVAAFGYFHVVVLLMASSPKAPVTRAIMGGVCLFLALMGNVLSKVKRNFYIGVRTPWTLASEPVWYATHRLAAKVFVATGVLCLVPALLLPNPVLVVIPMIAACMIPVVYSFIYYKRLEKQGADL